MLFEDDYPTTAVRFGGIYGPDRTRLINSVRDGTARMTFDSVYTNRIHIQDCVGALTHLIQLDQLFDIYLAVDEEPAPKNDVIAYIADRLGVALPEFDTLDESPQRGNKRCSNARLLASGYRFQYPTYREGYESIMST